jgi:high-affinity Fe2+/Pb2+ permease
MPVGRRHVLSLALLEVVLFVIAGVTSKSNKHPGTVSNIFWFAFLIGAVVVIVLALTVVVQSSRRRRRAG